MIELQRLELEGFKSFTNKTIFDFTKYPIGLHFITGINLVNPRLGANSTGKSTIVSDSLCWVLFNKTSVTNRNILIASWNTTDTCRVSLQFKVRNDACTLIRTYLPNVLTLKINDGKFIPQTQEELNEYLGITFESFLSSVLFAQFLPKFFDLSPTEKIELFDSIMEKELSRWSDRSIFCKELFKIKQEKLQELQIDKQHKLGYLDSLNKVDYSQEKIKFEITKQEKINRYTKICDNIINKAANLKEIVNKTEIKIKELTDEKNKANAELNVLIKELEIKEPIKSNFDTNIIELKQTKKLIEQEIIRLKQVGIENTCSKCKQSIDKKLLVNEINELDSKVSKLNAELNILESKNKFVINEILSLKNTIEYGKIELSKIDNEVYELNSVVKQNKYELTSLNTEYNNIKKDIEELQNTKNIYEQLEIKNNKTIDLVELCIRFVTDNLTNIGKELQVIEWWSKGFNEIRFLLLERCLKELEISINSVVQRFGMVGWSVQLKTTSETKSGNVKKGFTIFIKSPNSTDIIPFECWSGGEGQRLRLAGSLGLSSFIRDKGFGNINIIIMDEPTQFLSNEGINDFLDIFKHYCVMNDLKGFLIDHRELSDWGGFDSITTIINDKVNGSYIKE